MAAHIDLILQLQAGLPLFRSLLQCQGPGATAADCGNAAISFE